MMQRVTPRRLRLLRALDAVRFQRLDEVRGTVGGGRTAVFLMLGRLEREGLVQHPVRAGWRRHRSNCVLSDAGRVYRVVWIDPPEQPR
jgi:hypothetical protein